MKKNGMPHFVYPIRKHFEFNQDSKPKNVEHNDPQKDIPSSPLMSMGRATINVNSIPDPKECLCNRPQRTVVCSNCGFKAFGRIHYICAKHPGTSFLLDWPQCPHCRGYCLSEY